MRPRVSVVIPTLNEESTIGGALRQFSSLRKDGTVEVIVSDGNSSDKTADVAAGLADRMLIYGGAGRQGIAAGRNAGAAVAGGELIAFFDADVIIPDPKRFFATIIKTFSSQRIIAATANVHIYTEERRIEDVLWHSFFNRFVRFLNIIGLGMARGECQIVRASTFRAIGGYNEALHVSEDFDLFRRLRKIGRVHFFKELVVLESPRRYRKVGYGRLLFMWFTNALRVLFFKSTKREWGIVR